MKEQMKSNSKSMKEIFKDVGPILIQRGFIRLEIDHKSISKETNDPEKHGFGVMVVGSNNSGFPTESGHPD